MTVLVVLVLSVVAVINLRRSHTGLRWLAIRANPRAAAAAGVDVTRSRWSHSRARPRWPDSAEA